VRKRAVLFTIAILLTGLAVLSVFYRNGRTDFINDPYKAVPAKSVFLIETQDLQSLLNSLTTGTGLVGEMAKIQEFSLLFKKLDFWADRLNGSKYKELTEGRKVILSFLPVADDRLDFLLAMGLEPNFKIRDLKNVVEDSLKTNIVERKINGHTVVLYPYMTDNQHDTIYFTLESGLLIGSNSPEILGGAIGQIELPTDVRNAPGFSKVLGASGANEDKLFIIFENLTPIIKGFFGEGYQHLADKAGSIAGSAGLDLFLGENSLVVNGYAESIDPMDALYDFKSGTANEFSTYSILPATTGYFETFVPETVSEPTNKPSANDAATALASKLKDYIVGEVTKAYIDIKSKPTDENKLVIYKLKDRAYVEKLFLDEFSIVGSEGDILEFKPDDQINIPVYLTPFSGFGKALFPKNMWEINDTYFTFYGDYLITGSSYVTISKILYDNILNKTLANDLTYREFEETLPSVSGYFLYIVPSRSFDFFVSFLNENGKAFLAANRATINKLQTVGYQLAPSNEMIYNSLSLQYREEAAYESDTEWETLLDTVAAIKPFFFTNHTTGAKEIFIQDTKNNIYLINAAGRVLWKVPLRERINGSVFMVDLYKNGRYQLLFAGKEFIHIIDRNGNYVERFPVKLRSPATNSLALFDYDNNKDYRLLVAGEDKKVYAYDKTGNVVRGWTPFTTGSTVTSDISWLRVSGKDYLVVSDQNSIYFLDRTGNKRLTLKDAVSRAPGSALRLVSGASPSVVCTSKEGQLQHIYFDGSVKKYDIGNFSPEHSFDMFDITGDGISDYVFIDKGVLFLFDQNRRELFQKQFGTDGLEGPISFVFSSGNRKIGVFDPSEKLIYLVDLNGDIMEGFPLKGASLFSIGHLADSNKWNLIVGGTDGFLYNYSIDTQ